ncbi:sialate O-acetylesterase [Cerasicoccus maritimus]|uniref:sialate O-acetylesterase n=1 Tax=Cerasicoccus maritimus TaxID=490089 RepID=UPI002852CAC9|nr:sialate O-acetylesterase [Cerasicoccus maritimus]
MSRKIFSNFNVFTLLLGLLAVVQVHAADDSVPLPDKEHFHLYLLAGQSNMAGRGFVDEADNTPHPRVVMLDKEGHWVPAVDPVHYDKKAAGVGPGRTFAEVLAAEDDTVVIGLIPTACGGSSITKWVPGGYHDQTKSHPYDDALVRTHQAMEQGTLKGVLWHQGESDCKEPLSSQYQENLTQLIERFRAEFNDPNLPIVIGQLGQFPARQWNAQRREVDQAQRAVAESTPNVVFVPSDGLTSNPDMVHINAESQREFGHRYAKAYLDLVHRDSE